MAALRELSRRGTVGALSLLADMLIPSWPERWSVVGTALAGLSLGRVAQSLPGSLGFWSEAAILSTALRASRIRADAAELARCLDIGDLPGARMASTRLTGRDSVALADAELAAQGAEAVSTATADGVIAPLLYYVLAGLPGVMAYQLLASGSIGQGAEGHALSHVRRVPRRIADGLGIAARRIEECCSMGAEDSSAQSSDSGAAPIRRAMGQMRASVTLAGGALLLLAALSGMQTRRSHHLKTKG